MKTLCIVIPVYNEKDNIRGICDAIFDVLADDSMSNYASEVLLIDNCSTDGTRDIIKELCQQHKRLKAIFNSRNFGPVRSPMYGLLHSTADATIQMAADFQDPPELIPQFVRKWEEGCKVVVGIKKKSKENPVVYYFRSKYYQLLKAIADIDHIEQFTGYGLYDRKVVDALREMDDPYPYLRGMISEVGFQRAEIQFEQPVRKGGKTKTTFYSLYDIGMLGITSSSKLILRLSTFFGFSIAIFSCLVALIYLVLKLLFWDWFPMGSAPIVFGVFFIGAVQMFFIGIMGEYILTINTRVMRRPLVIEEERIGF